MSDIKLLPCPFCGGEAEMRRRIVKERNMFYVACKNEFGCVIGTTHLCDTIEEAIRRWNTRKPMERIIERLKEEQKGYICDEDDYCEGAYNAYRDSISTVKEVGEIE